MHEEYQNGNLQAAATLGDAMLCEHWINDAPTLGFSDDLYNLAIIHDEMDQPESAVALYSESARYIPDNGDFLALAKRSNNLAGVLARLGAMEPAQHFFTQTKHIYSRYLGQDHPMYADSLYNLANLALISGKRKDAQAGHKEALKIRKKSGNKDDIMHSLHSLAAIYEEEGDYEKAVSYAKTAVESAPPPDYATACNYLAELYELDDKQEEALKLYNEVLEAMPQTGCKRSDYLTILSRKAYLTGKTGNTKEALKLHEEACIMYNSLEPTDLLEIDDLYFANCMRNMAILHEKLGDPNQAEDFMLKSLNARKDIGGESTKDICFLIGLYLKNDTYDKAVDILIYALMQTSEDESQMIDSLTKALAKAENTHKLLESMGAINSIEKLRPIFEKWQG